MKVKTLGQVRCSIERTSSMLSTPYLHTGWAFENCALGCSLGLIFSGYVPLATSSPGDEFGIADLSDSYHIIRHFHISRNAPYLHPVPPPQKKKLHNLWFSFFLGFIAVLREIENNARAMQNLGKRRGAGGGGDGANKVHYWKCVSEN